MITREEDEEFSSTTKQEIDNNNINTNLIVSTNPSSSSSAISSSSWSRLKDPRIVRVSKAFGGKDRHSKVCTVRGLRDRRVRLSVPTAIQLYDLQDRLGLNQPSKVVDWLLEAAKHEIDELPPLQIPPPGLNFPQNLHYSMLMAANNASSSSHHQATDNRDDDEENLRAKSKETRDEKSRNEEMENLNLESHHHHHQQQQHGGYASLSTSDFLQKPSNNASLVQGLMNHNSLAYNNSSSSFLRWDPSNLSLSHHQPEDNDHHQQFQNFNNNSNVPLQPSTLNMMPSGSQVVLYPPFGVAHHPHNSYFDLQMLSSNSHNPISPNSLDHQHHVESSTHHHQHHQHQEAPPPVRPFHFSVMANFLPSPSHLNGGNETNKDNEYDSR